MDKWLVKPSVVSGVRTENKIIECPSRRYSLVHRAVFLVVGVTIVEYQLTVADHLLDVLVFSIFEFRLNRSEIHRFLYVLVVVRNFIDSHRREERPGVSVMHDVCQ